MNSWFERKGVLQKLRELLAERSIEGYLVGGYVRDQLLGRETNDLDLAVRSEAISLAKETADRLGGAFVAMGALLQTARVALRDEGRVFYLDFTAFRGNSVQADLAARDFTINAMAIDVRDRASHPLIVDPHGGQQDLERRLIRVVSERVFREDSLRLLRAVRFAAELDMQIESHTESLMRRDGPLVTLSSPERVRDELCRTLCTTRGGRSLRYLDGLRILTLVVPELSPLRGLEQPPPHRHEALEHSLATVEGMESLFYALCSLGGEGPARPDIGGRREEDVWSYLAAALRPYAGQLLNHLEASVAGERSRLVLLKLAALLHDAGKAATAKVDGTGRIRFLGHQAESAALVARALRRLRFSNREVRLVQTIVRHHMRPLQFARREAVSRRTIYRFFRDTQGAGIDVLLHAVADNVAVWDPEKDVEAARAFADTVALLLTKYFEEYDQVIGPPPLLRGDDLVGQLGMRPGPVVGRVLRAVHEAQAAGEIATREEALRLAETLSATDDV